MKVIEERDGKKLIQETVRGVVRRRWVSAAPKPVTKKKTAKKKASKKSTK